MNLLATTLPRIAIVGDAWGDREEQHGVAFAGSNAFVLKAMLAQAGIDMTQCLLTSAFNININGDLRKLYGDKAAAIPLYRALEPGKFVDRRYEPELQRLFRELETFSPTVIIALGNVALWALCKKVGLKKYRGTPLPSHDSRWKILPTYPPQTVMRQWKLRPIVISDLAKARRESEFPELRRPSRRIRINPSLPDIEAFYFDHIQPAEIVSCDIETKAGTITEVGYATSANEALVIPFYSRERPDGNYWRTAREEIAAWSWVRRINREKQLIGQNFQYDMQYFWRTLGITCPRFAGDTMLMHHTLQPEMEKGLGFLGSIYTDEPSWKFMRQDHSTLKTED